VGSRLTAPFLFLIFFAACSSQPDPNEAEFADFVETVGKMPVESRQAVLDSFLSVVSGYPFVENDTVAYFLFHGDVNSVTVPGDANDWNLDAFPMTRLAGTDLWYRQVVLEPDARLDYKFVTDGSNWILDPLNPNQVTGGAGPNSELIMPGYLQPRGLLFDSTVLAGVLTEFEIESSYLDNERMIQVYMPTAYEAGSDSFGVALFHDGQEWLGFASAQTVLDNLIAMGRIDPVIGVFVPPVDRNLEYGFDKADRYESFIVEELMPEIDRRFKTRRNPAYRSTIGVSLGGLISAQIAYRHPDQFGLAAAFSPAFQVENQAILREVLDGSVRAVRFYVDWGTYEPTIQEVAADMRDGLQERGYDLLWREWHEGHSWGSWRAHLEIALDYLHPVSAER